MRGCCQCLIDSHCCLYPCSRFSNLAFALSGAQDSQRTKKAVVATKAAVVTFWPAAFLVGRDKQTAAELAQIKGQMVALEQAFNCREVRNPISGRAAAPGPICPRAFTGTFRAEVYPSLVAVRQPRRRDQDRRARPDRSPAPRPNRFRRRS